MGDSSEAAEESWPAYPSWPQREHKAERLPLPPFPVGTVKEEYGYICWGGGDKEGGGKEGGGKEGDTKLLTLVLKRYQQSCIFPPLCFTNPFCPICPSTRDVRSMFYLSQDFYSGCSWLLTLRRSLQLSWDKARTKQTYGVCIFEVVAIELGTQSRSQSPLVLTLGKLDKHLLADLLLCEREPKWHFSPDFGIQI